MMRTQLRAIAAGSLALAAALTLGACSGDSPEETTSTTTTTTSDDGSSTDGGTSTTGGSNDQSAKVLGFAKPTAAGKAAAKSGRIAPGAILQVWSVRSSATGTVVSFSISANAESEVSGDFREWEEMPTVYDPKSRTEWSVTTYVPKDGKRELKDRRDAVSSRLGVADKLAKVRYYTALYPPLPDSVKSVQIKHDAFEPATATVTR